MKISPINSTSSYFHNISNTISQYQTPLVLLALASIPVAIFTKKYLNDILNRSLAITQLTTAKLSIVGGADHQKLYPQLKNALLNKNLEEIKNLCNCVPRLKLDINKITICSHAKVDPTKNWEETNFCIGVKIEKIEDYKNFLEIVKEWIAHDFNVNAIHEGAGCQFNNKPLLHWSLDLGCFEAANYFLEHGSEVNSEDSFGYTPLHYAAKKGNLIIIQKLLDKGVNVNATARYGETPLLWALEANQKRAAQILLTVGATADFKNFNHDEEYIKKIICVIISLGGINSIDNRTLLHTCLIKDFLGNFNPELATFVISNGANLLAKDKDGKIPFDYNTQFAITWLQSLPTPCKAPSFFRIVKERNLTGKQDPNIEILGKLNQTNEEGGTLLHWFAKKNYPTFPQIIELLLEKGVIPNTKDKEGKKPEEYCNDPKIKAIFQRFRKNKDSIKWYETRGIFYTTYWAVRGDYELREKREKEFHNSLKNLSQPALERFYQHIGFVIAKHQNPSFKDETDLLNWYNKNHSKINFNEHLDINNEILKEAVINFDEEIKTYTE